MVDRRARAEETRRQLLDAATRVFETSGYRATSVAAITKEDLTSFANRHFTRHAIGLQMPES